MGPDLAGHLGARARWEEPRALVLFAKENLRGPQSRHDVDQLISSFKIKHSVCHVLQLRRTKTVEMLSRKEEGAAICEYSPFLRFTASQPELSVEIEHSTKTLT